MAKLAAIAILTLLGSCANSASGTVIDPAGRPAAAVWIHLAHVEPGGRLVTVATSTSGPAGEYRLEDLTAGSYVVDFVLPDAGFDEASATRTLLSGSRIVEVPAGRALVTVPPGPGGFQVFGDVHLGPAATEGVRVTGRLDGPHAVDLVGGTVQATGDVGSSFGTFVAPIDARGRFDLGVVPVSSRVTYEGPRGLGVYYVGFGETVLTAGAGESEALRIGVPYHEAVQFVVRGDGASFGIAPRGGHSRWSTSLDRGTVVVAEGSWTAEATIGGRRTTRDFDVGRALPVPGELVLGN